MPRNKANPFAFRIADASAVGKNNKLTVNELCVHESKFLRCEERKRTKRRTKKARICQKEANLSRTIPQFGGPGYSVSCVYMNVLPAGNENSTAIACVKVQGPSPGRSLSHRFLSYDKHCTIHKKFGSLLLIALAHHKKLMGERVAKK